MSNLKEYIVSQILKYDKEKETLKKELYDLKKELYDLKNKHCQLELLNDMYIRDKDYFCDTCECRDKKENFIVCYGWVGNCDNLSCGECINEENGKTYCEGCFEDLDCF